MFRNRVQNYEINMEKQPFDEEKMIFELYEIDFENKDIIFFCCKILIFFCSYCEKLVLLHPEFGVGNDVILVP